MRIATEGKGYSVDQYCEILVDKATERMQAADAFADWEPEKKSKSNRPLRLSDAERMRLSDLEKEVARLKKENLNAQLLKASKPNNPSTGASTVGNTGCWKCGKEGHRADQCPDKTKPTPTKSLRPHRLLVRQLEGQPAPNLLEESRFQQVQPNTLAAVPQEAVKNTASVQETVAAMEKKGSQNP
jgi:hypothetical protein